MEEIIDRIIKEYNLDKPLNPKDLDNKTVLVARETACAIIFLLSNGKYDRLNTIKNLINEKINKLREVANGRKI